MSERVEREAILPAGRDAVWELVTASGWLAEEVALELRPGGEASFTSASGSREGWVEEVRAPERLAFWWAEDGEPASRVELALDELPDGRTLLRIRETRPLELLDLVGIPVARPGGPAFGPALVAR